MPERTPVNRGLRHLGGLAAGFMAAVVVACSGMGEPAGPVESAPTASPTHAGTTQTGMAALSPTATSKPSAVQAPSPGVDYDSTENMFRLFSGPGHDPDNTRQAISLAVVNNVIFKMPRSFGRTSRTICSRATGSSACPSTETTGRIRCAS